MNRFFSRLSVRLTAAALAGAMLLSSGCTAGGTEVEKIDLENAFYSVRGAGARTLDANKLYGAQDDAALVDAGFLDVLSDVIGRVAATAYVIDFTGTRGEFDDAVAASEYAESYFETTGEADVILQSELEANGIWGALVDGELIDDIKTLWINRYENLDGQMEYVIDVSRNSQPLRTLRYIYNEGDAAPALTTDSLAINYDGREPAISATGEPAATGEASTMYFRGNLYRTGIYEQPVLGGVDFLLSISANPVEGECPGDFAGMLEGTVTIDGVAMSFTTNGNDIPVPLGIVDDPSEWYIGIARISTNNPQDTTGYRNIFYVRTDFSEVVGLYSTYRSATFSEWFSLVRIDKSEYDGAVSENNKKLTDLYSGIMVDAYGDKKEYNNTLAVLYNMFFGVDHGYLKENLKKGISSISTDIRDYVECYMDESVARLGENDLWFFPDGRSTVIRLYEYDGTTAIAAVDFSTKQDDGYGGLYKGVYDESSGQWTLERLTEGRIK